MRERMAIAATVAALALTAVLALPGAAAGKSSGQLQSFAGVTVPGSPYRYIARAPTRFGVNGWIVAAEKTTVARVSRDGGRPSRWWFLKGTYGIPAVSYDPTSGGGLSADGTTLVLSGFAGNTYPPRVSRFAVIDTGIEAPGRAADPRYISLPGDLSVHAISPDGSTLYLIERTAPGSGPAYITDHDIRALDLESGRLRPGTVGGTAAGATEPEGLPVSRASSRDGRWAYTLYTGEDPAAPDDERVRPFLEALDTAEGHVWRLPLPQLADRSSLYMLRLRALDGGRELVVEPSGSATGPLVRIDTARLTVVPPEGEDDSTATGLALVAAGAILFGLAILAATRRRRSRRRRAPLEAA